MASHFLQHRLTLIRVHDLHHLDLVELVLANQTAGIASVATRLGAEARGVGRELHGQVGLGQ